MSARFVIGGPLRLFLGLALAGLAGALFHLGRNLGWGMAWVAWIPAVLLVPIAVHLVRRIVLLPDQGGLAIEMGWLYRRAWRFGLAGSELEIVPTAGLRAVILHRHGRSVPLATWLTTRRAEALCSFLDTAAGEDLPRRQSLPPAGDR